jgi:hypothetical protein
MGAAAGIAGLLLNESPVKPAIPNVNAVSGTGVSGQVAYWADATGTLTAFQSVLDPAENALALGSGSLATGTNATVGGGNSNSATGGGSTVGGGDQNVASGTVSTIGGGISNTAAGDQSTVGGGNNNAASAFNSTVGGGSFNQASASGATVGGGVSNRANGAGATVGGGISGSATGFAATIGGGESNTASSFGTTVAGGFSNAATQTDATVGGGDANSAGGPHATVGGGANNTANGGGATVGGGGFDGTIFSGNVALGNAATIGGGLGNTARNTYATVPGGVGNSALGGSSFAAGSFATVLSGHHGALLFSDDTYVASGVTFQSAGADEFAARAIGGVRFVTSIDVSGNVTQQLTVSSSGFLGVSTSGPSTPEYAIDLRTPGKSGAQMHIAPTDSDSGGYLTSANAGNLFMSAGAVWNGSSWVAKSSTAYQYGGGPAGVRFFFDTGLTVGGTYTPTTRMFIGPTGHVGIGMSTAPAHLLQLGLDDAAKPGTSTWTIASDGRLKDPESIRPFTEGSEFIKRLPQPVWFRYRKDSGLPSDRPFAGWVAQDVVPVAPFMVRQTKQRLRETDTDDTETLSLNTNELPFALVNFAKEVLQHQEEMLTEISELKARLGRLENQRLTST